MEFFFLFLLCSFCPRWQADHDALYSAVKAHGVSVVTHAADTGGAPRGSRGDPATLAHLGVTGTLDTVFEAPPLVRHVLCDSAGLSSTLVGTAEADGHWERLQAQHGVDLLCTPTTVYRHKRSRHDPGATTTSMKPLPPGRLFSAATSEAQRAERAAQLAAAVARERDGRAAVARLEQEVARLGAGVEALSRRREALDKAAKADAAVRRKAAAAAAALEKEVDVLRREAAAAGGGDGAAVARAEKGLAEACRAHAAAALAASRQLLRACAAVVARSPHVGRQAEARERARALRKSLEGAGAEAAKARDLAARLTAAVAADKAAARKALAVAEAAGGGPLGEAQRAQFRGLPDDADELEALIRSTLDEADAILCPNPGVVAEYAKRRAEIEALGAAHAGASARLASAQAHIDAVRAAWLPSLRALFSRISASFSAAMAAVGCAGEVGLDERGDAFADYAVVIKVKFRSSEPLMPLTAHRQSGGERSVRRARARFCAVAAARARCSALTPPPQRPQTAPRSTMLYLIALQDLTACPFRVVDEINQGMDPVNERKIFSQARAPRLRVGTRVLHSRRSLLFTSSLLPPATPLTDGGRRVCAQHAPVLPAYPQTAAPAGLRAGGWQGDGAVHLQRAAHRGRCACCVRGGGGGNPKP